VRRYAFDLLEINCTDLRRDSWEVRRATLTSLLRRAGDGIRLSEHLATTDGNTIFRHACAMGLEGIVAKRRDRPYRSGRSPDWIKVKNPDAPAATRILEWWRSISIAFLPNQAQPAPRNALISSVRAASTSFALPVRRLFLGRYVRN
jgi:ATP dependent DNA ligase domain